MMNDDEQRLPRISTTVKYRGAGDRIHLLRRCLECLEMSHPSFKMIRVGGTNGKGSTSMMISRILRAQHLSVGMFTSPYILDVREQIQFNHQWISQATWEHILSQMQTKLHRGGIELSRDLSEFETHFLMAMLYFQQRSPQYVILECGLGGKRDATNAVFYSDYAIFTPIGMDHTDMLGNTLAEIVDTKVRMIRPREIVISAVQDSPVVSERLRQECENKTSPLYVADDVHLTVKPHGLSGWWLDAQVDNWNLRRLYLPMAGEYQLTNLKTVLKWWAVVQASAGDNWTTSSLRLGLRRSHGVGRMDSIFTDRHYLLDGAHNADGIAALVRTLNRDYRDCSKIVIVGFLADKDISACLRTLGQLTNGTFIATTPQHPTRALGAAQLAEQMRRLGMAVKVIADADKVIPYCETMRSTADMVVVTGSFYLLRTLLPLLNKKPAKSDSPT